MRSYRSRTVKSVSYTHLDVYKRQAIDEAVEEVVEDDAAVTVEVEVTGEEAVSYTHLQGLRCLYRLLRGSPLAVRPFLRRHDISDRKSVV